MSLAAGDKLGPYEILAPLGAGGMGEVFRARDSRLGRDVAIKVVPDLLAGEPEVRARFEREARAASALNHPHICQVYDVGREGDVDYIVMELIEGESLAQRLEKGALPAPEVLRVSTQIADALDRAHRAGIVHRDLKPGNIMLTKQGAKLVDFGLARPTGLGGPGSGSRAPGTPSSPTISRPLTAAGSIVGTFQYMAPEQLEGHEADARSDIWALGATMYEMATGQVAFEGKSQASLIASILGKEPRPISEIVPLSPPALERLVRACLAKDPDERVQTAHDVKLQLKWITEGGSQAGVPAPVAAQRRGRERKAWILAGGATLVAVGALAWIAVSVFGPKPARQTMRFVITAPLGATGISWPRMSPDGTTLAFMARDSTGTQRIWVRSLSSTAAIALPGTENSGRPFWSGDSKYLGFFADGNFKKIAAAGGPVQLVGEAKGASDGSWSASGVVAFDGTAAGDSIRAIPAGGGAVRPLSSLDRALGEATNAWPSFLPDGKHFLFQSFRKSGLGKNLIRLGTLGTLKSVVLDSSDSRAEFLPPGYIVFVRDGAVMARKLNLGKARLEGDPSVLGEGAGTTTNTQAFSVANTGTIAYQATGAGGKVVVSRYDRAGKRLAQMTDPAGSNAFSTSPDGLRIVISVIDEGTQKSDLWIRDIKRGTLTRFTFDPANEIWPVWSPDGATIAFASDRSGDFRIMTKPASGLVEEVLVAGQKLGDEGPLGWSADGTYMLAQVRSDNGDWDAVAISLGDSSKSVVIAATKFNEATPRLSPNGKFVAYSSDESGIPEIYAQPFPTATGRWQVSVKGGQHPFWSAGAREILYRGPGAFVVSVPMAEAADGSLQPGVPVNLIPGILAGANPGRYQPVLGGQFIDVLEPAGQNLAQVTPIIVILDPTAELKKK